MALAKANLRVPRESAEPTTGLSLCNELYELCVYVCQIYYCAHQATSLTLTAPLSCDKDLSHQEGKYHILCMHVVCAFVYTVCVCFCICGLYFGVIINVFA